MRDEIHKIGFEPVIIRFSTGFLKFRTTVQTLGKALNCVRVPFERELPNMSCSTV